MSKRFLIKDDITVNKMSSVIKLHILLQCLNKGLEINTFSFRELSIIAELYMFGGIDSKESFNKFFEHCKSLDISTDATTVQTIRNTFSKARGYKILKRPKSNNWFIHLDILPKVEIAEDNVLKLEYTVENGKTPTGNN